MQPRSNRLIPFLIGTALVLLLGVTARLQDTWRGLEILRRLEWMTYDLRVKRAFSSGSPVSEHLGFVPIDQFSLEDINNKYGHVWPLPRYYYGLMVQELDTQGIKAVAMDMFFTYEDSLWKGLKVPLANGSTIGSDQLFAQLLKRSGKVIIAAPQQPADASRLVMPLPLFRSSASVGHAVGTLDSDSVLRRVKPFIDEPEAGRVWQLGIMLAARGLGVDLDKAQVEPRRIILTTGDGQKRILPLDANGCLLVNWSISLEDPRTQQQNLVTVLGSTSHRRHGGDPPNVWKDRLVLVGSTAAAKNVADRGATSLERNAILSSTHWNVANSILVDQQITCPGLPVQWGILALLTAVSVLVTWKLRAGWTTLTILVIVAAYGLVCFWLFTTWRICLPMVLPIAGALLLAHVLILAVRAGRGSGSPPSTAVSS